MPPDAVHLDALTVDCEQWETEPECTGAWKLDGLSDHAIQCEWKKDQKCHTEAERAAENRAAEKRAAEKRAVAEAFVKAAAEKRAQQKAKGQTAAEVLKALATVRQGVGGEEAARAREVFRTMPDAGRPAEDRAQQRANEQMASATLKALEAVERKWRGRRRF